MLSRNAFCLPSSMQVCCGQFIAPGSGIFLLASELGIGSGAAETQNDTAREEFFRPSDWNQGFEMPCGKVVSMQTE